MGATEFMTKAKGQTARAAFQAAVEEALYENGHGGYSGTIAEKQSFKVITVTEEFAARPEDFAERLLDENDKRIADKWGPAGCVDLGNGEWLFFGVASC